MSITNRSQRVWGQYQSIMHRDWWTWSRSDCIFITKEYSFKLNKTNKRTFDIMDHGLTLKGTNDWQNNAKLYAFGTIMFAKFLQKPWKLIVDMRLNRNCVNNGILDLVLLEWNVINIHDMNLLMIIINMDQF